MRRILIDDRIKKLAAEYVKKLPLVVGDVKADLQILADDFTSVPLKRDDY